MQSQKIKEKEEEWDRAQRRVPQVINGWDDTVDAICKFREYFLVYERGYIEASSNGIALMRSGFLTEGFAKVLEKLRAVEKGATKPWIRQACEDRRKEFIYCCASTPVGETLLTKLGKLAAGLDGLCEADIQHRIFSWYAARARKQLGELSQDSESRVVNAYNEDIAIRDQLRRAFAHHEFLEGYFQALGLFDQTKPPLESLKAMLTERDYALFDLKVGQGFMAAQLRLTLLRKSMVFEELRSILDKGGKGITLYTV